MKTRMCSLILLISLTVLATGCSNDSKGDTRNSGVSGSVEEVLFQKISEEDDISSVDAEAIDNQAMSQDSAMISSDSNLEAVAADDSITPIPYDTATAEEEHQEKSAPGADVDLTVLSSTMVYSEVYNMMVSPDDYIGKTVKMKGQFVPYYDESTGKYYFACFISDATACCSQGIEFILTDDYLYPEDYPMEGATICVVGTFDTYMEGENMYCTLRNALLL